MTWKCPRCNSDALDVVVQVTARLDQFKDGNFETDADCSHEWDETSPMTCRECGHNDAASKFSTEDHP